MIKSRNKLEQYKLDVIIDEIRNLLVHEVTESDNLVDIEWIINILLMSKDVFKTVKEVDIFLSNMTGLVHNTKSTGRDRIINWYFNKLHEMSLEDQNKILYKISKYLFITFSSNYVGWKNTLYRGKGKKNEIK